MRYDSELKLVRRLLNVEQEELASLLDVSFETINRWENGSGVDNKSINKILTLAYDNGIYVNDIYEMFLNEEYEKGHNVLVFHGSRNGLEFPIDFKHSKSLNDFGRGFYLGETLDQASIFVSGYNNNESRVYAFSLNKIDLKILKFNVNQEWMLAIAYYRNQINKYSNNKIIKKIIKDVDSADVIIAPIADNRMYDIIREFLDGYISDEVCLHALAATNLGKQYVLKSKKALNRLSLVKEFYISNKEKDKLIKDRFKISELGFDKARAARIKYQGKGKYIEDLLK